MKLVFTILLASMCLCRQTANAAAAVWNNDTAPQIEELQALVADLALKYDALTNAVRYIERKCETDKTWRNAYHGPVEGSTVLTNELGIVYRVDIHRDGFVYADYSSTVKRVADPEAKAKSEAAQKALVEAKREEALQAMERAKLPARVAEIMAARRAALKPVEKTVVIDATK